MCVVVGAQVSGEHVVPTGFWSVCLILAVMCDGQVNMWIGNAVHGSSSGLHHDFHDNLYVTGPFWPWTGVPLQLRAVGVQVWGVGTTTVG